MPAPSRQIAEFAANLDFEDIPDPVLERAKWLFLDWYGSAVAGSTSHSTTVLLKFAKEMGPGAGPCRIIGHPDTTSPWFAALINGASSHVVEQDDLHNSSILHPGTVVFPPVFALAQSNPEISGRDFLTAAVVGYECGIRTGEFLGRSHYRIFHMTATAGTVAAAMAAGRLLNLDSGKMLHALGSAGTQAGGLWEFLRDAADSKQLHTAKASADGLLAACSAKDGMTAAGQILEGRQGMAAGMNGEGDVAKLTDRLGTRWALSETSFKYHASCRHTHPAADALLQVCNEHDIRHQEIESIRVFVYQAAQDVLGKVDVPDSIHQSKFSMGFVLALIARYRSASVSDFSVAALADPVNSGLREKVHMIVDNRIDSAYPDKWGSRVEVKMKSGALFAAFTDCPKGDPGNMLSQQELEQKVLRLAEFSGRMDADSIRRIIAKTWRLSAMESFAGEFH